MGNTISTAFVAQYGAEVKHAYQQRGSKLRNTVRLKTGVIGSTHVFQALGTGTAGTKTRNGNVPVMNPTHSTAPATLTDWYAGEYVDKLDEIKTNIDERRIVAASGAMTLGRKVDNLIITELDAGAGTSDTSATLGLTRTRVLTAIETLAGEDVPFDGRVFGLVGPHQWSELLLINQFADADYVGADGLPWKTGPIDSAWKQWLGVKWQVHTGLPLSSGTRKCFLYHSDAIGLAEGQGIVVSIDWVPEKASTFIDHMLSAGCKTIDADGIYEIQCDDDETLSDS